MKAPESYLWNHLNEMFLKFSTFSKFLKFLQILHTIFCQVRMILNMNLFISAPLGPFSWKCDALNINKVQGKENVKPESDI